jgi:hypothetical protein
MEKVIQEFRVIETDDGYRIEIKGDKEKIKSFMQGFGGRKHRRRHWKRRWRGPFGFGPMAWMRAMHDGHWDGPWDFETKEDEEEEKED